MDGGTTVNLFRNYLHDNNVANNAGTGEIMCASVNTNLTASVYYNIIKSTGYAMWAQETANVMTLSVYNNSVWGTNAQGLNYLLLFSGATTINLKNNIMDGGGNYSKILYCDTAGTFTRDYNNYYDWTDGTNVIYDDGWVTWAALASEEANSINSDPLMTDPANGDFTLLTTSPCREKGTIVGLTQDYAGNVVPQGLVDIGAYEYPGGGAIFFGCNF